MNVPLKWLSEYVELPKSLDALTHRLTMVGHMLDKVTKRAGDTVIDLELRGNRSDMFGLIGVARDVAAIFGKELRLPSVTPLPKTDLQSPLVHTEKSAEGLVKRYIAVKLSVKVAPSPKWLADRLVAYGIEPINNVVDITNYVMVETSHPLHAFDFDKLKGEKLILRRAWAREKFATITAGTTLTLTFEDLAICDSDSVQGLTTIGGLDTKVTSETKNILLETAVYDAAGSRRTARRHKTSTESGLRHEKLQDPAELPFTLARAVHLLTQIASARVISNVSDYYPHPVQPKVIRFDPAEVARLTGLSQPASKITSILNSLEFSVSGTNVTVPTFRTDIEGPADLVEEVVRLVSYDSIPETPLSGPMPDPQTYPSYALQEQIRDILVSLGVSEAITTTMTPAGGPDSLRLINPPDPTQPFLRTQLYPNLINYAQKLLHQKIARVALFEIGKVFHKSKNKYLENLHLAIVLSGTMGSANWRTPSPRQTDIYDLTGLVTGFQKLSGLENLSGDFNSTAGIFSFETNLDKLGPLRVGQEIYTLSPRYPAIIEDVNVSYQPPYSALIKRLYKLSPLIKNIDLVDKYGDKLTLRITYHSNSRQLSSADIAPVRTKITALLDQS